MINFKDVIVVTDEVTANIKICTSIYSMDAIRAATYAFTDRYNIFITKGSPDEVVIVFESKGLNSHILNDLKDFSGVLIERQLRCQLEARNGKIRDIIVGHAFSQVDLHNAVKAIGEND